MHDVEDDEIERAMNGYENWWAEYHDARNAEGNDEPPTAESYIELDRQAWRAALEAI